MISELNIELHDSVIMKVIENTSNDTLDFVLDYPTDYDNNVFGRRILRFYNCLNYSVKEIPFSSNPTILEYKNHGEINYAIGSGRNEIKISRYKTELITNAGFRSLEYDKFELLSKES